MINYNFFPSLEARLFSKDIIELEDFKSDDNINIFENEDENIYHSSNIISWKKL